jgi:Uma2 family endonuclease
MPGPALTTYEYLRTPETMRPQELVYGFVREAAAPTPRHQGAVGELYFHLRLHLTEHPVGRVWMSPIDVVLDRDRDLVVQPDLVVVMDDRLHLVTDRVWGPPNLAIEILSPRPRIGDVDERLAWFARYGVEECWLVNQAGHEIDVLAFARGGLAGRTSFGHDEPIRSAVLPLFSLTPARLLEDA